MGKKRADVVLVERGLFDSRAKAQAAIEAGKEALGNDGRILVRASGTESLIRVMAEGRSQEQLEDIVTDIASIIDQELGIDQR